MIDQKQEPILNLALDTPEEERDKSQELQTGYDEVTRRWELIVRYSGDIGFLEMYDINITYLINNYAIINVPERYVDKISDYEEIIYVEKPKRVYFQLEQGIRASCINSVQVTGWRDNTLPLFGNGVLCGIIDTGIDYSHPAFLNADGTTRIIRLWDQSVSTGTPPEGYSLGSIYTEEDINEALRADSSERYSIVPSRDISGHGTHVAGIMAGNFAANRENNMGIATRSRMIVVKLGNAIRDGFPRTSELMQAVNYIVLEAIKLNQPVSVNLSFGNNYGSHDGTSLIESFLDTAVDNGRTVLTVGAGNEGASAGHTGGFIGNNEIERVELAVGDFQPSFSIQIWKEYVDEFIIEIGIRGKERQILIQSVAGPSRFNYNGNELLIYYGEPSPYSRFQEIYIDFIPEKEFITSGIWEINLVPVKIIQGRYDMWLPVSGALNEGTFFLTPNADTTLTIPSTANNAITVGAYDSRTLTVADFSGRGYTRLLNQVKPDLLAPGVDITSAAPGGGLAVKSGTSMAAPFVSGSAALMMEWGIIQGNDRYLYGEKLKAYLIKGANPLPGYEVRPNPLTGWGALCLRNSFAG